MSEICGFGGFKITDGAGGPDQSFRFFLPIFLHDGFLHLLVNMAVQCFGSTAQVSRSLFFTLRTKANVAVIVRFLSRLKG